MKKIFAVSIMAVMAVTAANAEIASKAYVDQQDDAVEAIIGALADLQTNTQSSVVAAINELNEAVGDVDYSGKADAVTGEGGTHTKITYNTQGVVTAGADLQASDIPDISATYQTVANKTTSVTSSSTDAQYPSAKAVYDAIEDAAYDDTALEARVAANETAIGDATSGLTKGVADNAAAIAALDSTYATDQALTDGLALKQALSDSTVANGTYNYITQGAGVASNLVALDTNLKTVEGTAGDALPAATYNSQVGTVSAANMGTTASTVVGAISEVAGVANAAIPAPTTDCTNLNAKCVLTVGSAGYAWEVVQRGTGE